MWGKVLVCAAVAAAGLLLWMLVLMVTTRAMVVRAQAAIDMAPDAIENVADVRRLLSFSVIFDPAAGAKLGPAPARPAEVGLCSCGEADSDGAATELLPGRYSRTMWLPLRHESGAQALAGAVASGRVRYLMIAGAVVRVAYAEVPDHGHQGHQGHQGHGPASSRPSALLLMDLSSFQPPDGCRAVVPVAALPGASSSPAAWADLVGVLGGFSSPALHVLGF